MHNTLLVVSNTPENAARIDSDMATEAINNYKEISDYAQEVKPENAEYAMNMFDLAYGHCVDIDERTIHVRPSLDTLKAHLKVTSDAARKLVEQIDFVLATEFDDTTAKPEMGSTILYRTMAMVSNVDHALVDPYSIYVLVVKDEPTWALIATPADEWLVHAQAGEACDYTVTQVFSYHV